MQALAGAVRLAVSDASTYRVRPVDVASTWPKVPLVWRVKLVVVVELPPEPPLPLAPLAPLAPPLPLAPPDVAPPDVARRR